MYKPKPVETSWVELPPELQSLMEQLAEHNHDLWARSRMREGWSRGAERDDTGKRHPDLVPYQELSESEKDYDRQTAAEVLKAVVAMGFTISRRGSPAFATSARGVDSTPQPAKPGLDFEQCRLRAKNLLDEGEPLLAYDLVQEALALADDLRLRQLKGLALARSGAIERANKVFQALHNEGHEDGETLGPLARTHKDLANLASKEADQRAQLEQAYKYYERGFILASQCGHADDAIYTGINSATIALLLGRREHAQEIAHYLRTLCQREIAKEGEDGAYWNYATLGEAALILGNWKEAEKEYAHAAEIAGTGYAKISSTRRQARLLLAHLGEDTTWLDRTLAVPPIVVFAGHMIDRPGRKTPRFPPSLERVVAHEIRTCIDRLRPAAAYASAACGADIVFLEAMLARGGEVHVILPFRPDEFRRYSVEILPDPDWGRRFDYVLDKAKTVTSASDDRASGSTDTFLYTNLIQTGMADLHARTLETQLIPLTVWDGRGGDGRGGTASIIEHWLSRDYSVERIDLASLARDQGIEIAPSATPRTRGRSSETKDAQNFPHTLKAMLFADAVGYSKLSENQIPIFVDEFLGAVAQLIDRTSHVPILKETIGDGLYFVFSSVRDAGHFALELSDLVRDTDWVARGLPSTLDLRVGLHCGPVYECVDPVTGQEKFTGPHTSRTARIEPITPPGQVYASQAFAAVAAATGINDLKFDYVGQTALAKKYGSFPLYHVTRGF